MDSSAQQLFTAAQVAAQLGTQAWNVRRWADYHADHLTPQQPGQPRRFTNDDIDTLRVIAQQRAAGLTAAQVNQWLEKTKIGQVVDPENVPAVQESAPLMHPVDSATHVQIRLLFDQVADLRRRQRDGATMFALGALCMGVLILIILLLYWLGA